MGLFSMEHDSEYKRFALKGDDPRFVGLIMRDEYPEAPDWDHDARIAIKGGGYGGRDDYISPDEDLASIIGNARDYLRDDETVARYLRIFHGASEVGLQDFGWYGSATLWAVIDEDHDSPDHKAFLKAVMDEWRAYDSGDVYGVGVLYNPDHVLWADDESAPTEEGDGWKLLDYSSWGLYGDEAAEEVVRDELAAAIDNVEMHLLDFAA